MRAFLLLLFALPLLGVLGFQLNRLYIDRGNLEARLLAVQKQGSQLEKDAATSASDLEYLKNPENAAKEAKNIYNLKRPGEELIILVPPQTKTNE